MHFELPKTMIKDILKYTKSYLISIKHVWPPIGWVPGAGSSSPGLSRTSGGGTWSSRQPPQGTLQFRMIEGGSGRIALEGGSKSVYNQAGVKPKQHLRHLPCFRHFRTFDGIKSSGHLFCTAFKACIWVAGLGQARRCAADHGHHLHELDSRRARQVIVVHF